MNRSMEIIKKIRGAFEAGSLAAGEVPAEDLVACVRLEIQTNHLTYLEKQCNDVMGLLDDLEAASTGAREDAGRMRLFLIGLEMCLQTVSESVLSLVSREYWEMMHAKELPDPEIEEVIDYVAGYGQVRLLPYAFVDDYLNKEQPVDFDPDCGMYYVMHKGKRMYFPPRMDAQRVAEYYRVILAEQDRRSPHCYDKEGYGVRRGDVLADCGGAEGYFVLEHIDIISKAYIFDADREWISAMERTFAPYGGKVEICYGYVGDEDDGTEHIMLDSALKGVRVSYIKMDIEGYEKGALRGCESLINESDDLRMAVCSYHNREDYDWIEGFFWAHGMESRHSHGYMCPDWCSDGLLRAELRRGVVFGRKGAVKA